MDAHAPIGRAVHDLRTQAERRIRAILVELEEAEEREVDQVRVDTRNFANLTVEIFFKGE